MDREIEQKIKEFLERIRNTEYFSKIEFIILYGSSLGSYHLDDSDIDICIYIDKKRESLSRIRINLLEKFSSKFDIQIYQLLPLYIQIEVLKGDLLYVKNVDKIYEIADNTIEEFEDFYPFYLDYING
ncbi:MAG: nucleotidyltransferase domain-containing protein [Promethearchaeota archaeon]|nr:MAG: nucleotidyltransferase domain-containing protein [Candidatus Lokiarchaeota archaeon]